MSRHDIERHISSQAAGNDPQWAIAYALLRVADAIESADNNAALSDVAHAIEGFPVLDVANAISSVAQAIDNLEINR